MKRQPPARPADSSAARGMAVTILAAVAENGIIGRDGRLPWHLPDDFKRVKLLSSGHTLIMGRRTHESIGKPLPDRRSIVLSRDPAYRPAGVDRADDLDQALGMARQDGETVAFVFGGASVFAEALPIADRLELTVVHAEPEGDVRFPDWDPAVWRLVSEQRFDPDRRHTHGFSFRTFLRRRVPP